MYDTRRKSFISKMSRGGIALFKSAPNAVRCRGIEYPYRQDSDFYYLTGLEESDSACLLVPNHAEHQFVLFVCPQSRERHIWKGKHTGIEGAINVYGANLAYSINQLEEIIPNYLDTITTLYYGNGQGSAFDEYVIGLLKQKPFSSITRLIDPSEILNEMRQIKQDEELNLLRKAATITAEAHKEAMRTSHPGMYEYEIQAVVEHIFRKQGSPRNGYESIIASGPNSTSLHYSKNNRCMKDGDLLLIDAGAEYGYYTADITRTFPVNGRFSPEQRAVYDIVLKAQHAAISQIKPGVRLIDIHNTAVFVITHGLVELGILKGKVNKLIEVGAYKNYFMHSTSHWLGLDIWDRGNYGENEQSIKLKPGMVFTVEPGIYIAGNTKEVNTNFWNIGIRIEDNILVTSDGFEVLTDQVPKEIEEIESLCLRN